ncbi:hypothetical protein Q5P01_010025 [Channa striata]|uniref:Protein NPAT C-terminal domain-containing protein n=1 Tax=Channa striata TaxID=64152 RepID=A0AA88N024_CHASR|nr:hypothetical protein Q5P01_010025 [Channa striata]
MLLPSDVARLVLGYLQEEGLSATSRAFILESPNLKEYAEHTTGDGTVPACVFSIFGKGLTTILNEYVAAKTKETCHEVPVVLTSLWKKLDFTLNQIKSLQNSPAISASQRTRSRIGVANMAKERTQAAASAASVICSSISETSSFVSPVQTSHSMLGHSTPMNYTALHTRHAPDSGSQQHVHDGNRILNTPRDSPMQIFVTESRLNSGPVSPGRRKWEMPRKRNGAQSGCIGTSRHATTTGNVEPQTEEVVDENFPQLVIQNARDKILGDRSLQEKLAENINKILANEPLPQTSKASSSTVEADQSIDEILGLQGEIHMSDDAIHDILEQTESDPAFQALFDLFDYNKTKFTEDETGDGDVSSSPEESDTPAPSCAVRPPHTDDQGTGNIEATASETAQGTVKMKPGQDPSSAAPFTMPDLPTSASTSASLTATSASYRPVAPPTSSTVQVTAAPDSTTIRSSTTNKTTDDSGNIVSLKIIISDKQDEDPSTDTALDQAITSISGDKIPTIYLSSPAKSPGCPGTPKVNADEVAQAVNGLQNSEAYASPLSSKTGMFVSSPLPGTSQAPQSYIIQLPSTNPALQGPPASYLFVSDTSTTDAATRPVLLPAGVSKGQPLPTNPYGVTTPACSQGYPTGSTLILPSPVKPLMLPVSAMGQNTLGNVQMVSNQLVAIQNPVPIQQSETVQPKSSIVTVKQSSPAGTEKNVVGKVIQPVLAENIGQKDAEKGSSHRRILIFDSSAEINLQTGKSMRNTTSPAANAPTSQSKKSEKTEKTIIPLIFHRTKPTILGGNKTKRSEETSKSLTDPQTVNEAEKFMLLQQPQKDSVKKNSRKQHHNIHNQEPQRANTSRVDSSQPETLKRPDSRGQSKSIDRKHNHDKIDDKAKAKNSHGSRSLSSDSGNRKDKEESSRKEPAEKASANSREGRTEKRTSSQEMPNVTANKENEMKGSMQEQQQPSTASSSATRDFSPSAITQSTSNPQSMATKPPSKTSSLAKQAAEMLQDIQSVNSPSTPINRPGARTSDLSLSQTPVTGCNQEESADCSRTPPRQRRIKDGEGTPKHLMPPNTPDVPTCSPASEAGSENSINMAAHTLMILSRAAIARTGTPLKDSLRQEEVGEKSHTSSKIPKKRKHSSPSSCPPTKKDSKRSPSKKKDQERKKLVDCFPHDLDVDKFLSSLHYDE